MTQTADPDTRKDLEGFDPDPTSGLGDPDPEADDVKAGDAENTEAPENVEDPGQEKTGVDATEAPEGAPGDGGGVPQDDPPADPPESAKGKKGRGGRKKKTRKKAASRKKKGDATGNGQIVFQKVGEDGRLDVLRSDDGEYLTTDDPENIPGIVQALQKTGDLGLGERVAVVQVLHLYEITLVDRAQTGAD